MKYRLDFHEEAELEYNESYVWYGLQQSGLEEKFRVAVDETLQKLRTNPQYFSYCKKPYRQALVRGFSFAIVFKINKHSNSIFISAIYHTHRNPKKKFRKQ
jgi:mRNA-degrading endonuclease RelE of RelBE toxin-antitoxin system